MYESYEKTRFNFSRHRKIVWEEIARYLQKDIPQNSIILDLGSGYCDFINSISGAKKYALDKYIDPEDYALEKVIKLFGDVRLMNKKIKNESLDVVFASNFLEHLNEKNLEEYMTAIQKKLKKNGLFIIIQPNYRFCYKNYFDDYTHVREWSDISLKDYLKTMGFSILKCEAKFLPFSMKSKFPKNRVLVRMYLRSPVRPFAGQMLVIAKKI